MSNLQGYQYEMEAQQVIDSLPPLLQNLGIQEVKGKRGVEGSSGVRWEIDAKGIVAGDSRFVIFECKSSEKKISVCTVMHLAYRVKDTNALTGIIVSPACLTTPAKKLACYEGIHKIDLPVGCETNEYQVRFLNQVFVGVKSTIAVTSEANAVHFDLESKSSLQG